MGAMDTRMWMRRDGNGNGNGNVGFIAPGRADEHQ